MNTQNISTKDWITGGVGLLLIIDLWFFPWFDWNFGGFGFSSSATGAPTGFLGWFAVLCVIAYLVDYGVEKFSPGTQLPAIGGSRATTRLALAGAAAVFLLLKFIFHTSYYGGSFGFGFFGAIVLMAALLFLSFQANVASASRA